MPKLTHDHISGVDRRSEDVLLHGPRPQMLETRRLFVDSRTATKPSPDQPFQFSIRLNDEVSRGRYKNVTEVSLKAASIPKVDGEDFVILDIEQLKDSNIDSSLPYLNDGFSVCYFDNSSLPPGAVKVIDKTFTQKAIFSPPKTLDRFDVTIRKYDGSIVSPNETANSNNVSFLFDVTMLTQ